MRGLKAKACVVVSENNFRRAISIVGKFDLAEIRLDLCRFNSTQIKELFSMKNGLIVTYRTNNKEEISYKLDLMKKALESGASYIDLEYDFGDDLIYEMSLFAKNYGAKLIISHHNYEKTETEKELKEIIENAKTKGADYIKIATKINSKEDSLKLFNLYESESNLIAFGLGEEAKYTRMTSLFLGAPFAYVYYLSKSKITEGQLSYKEFNTLVECL